MTNVACACGLTSSNYKELVDLHTRYGPQGLAIMAWCVAVLLLVALAHRLCNDLPRESCGDNIFMPRSL